MWKTKLRELTIFKAIYQNSLYCADGLVDVGNIEVREMNFQPLIQEYFTSQTMTKPSTLLSF